VIQLVIVYMLLCKNYPDELNEIFALQCYNDSYVYMFCVCTNVRNVSCSSLFLCFFFISSWETNININCILKFSFSSHGRSIGLCVRERVGLYCLCLMKHKYTLWEKF